MNRTALATVTGLILGLALVFGNFGDMLIVPSSLRPARADGSMPALICGCGCATAIPAGPRHR